MNSCAASAPASATRRTGRTRIIEAAPLFPAALVLFALASVLWFVLDLAITAQLVADESMRDQAHLIFGYAATTTAAATVAGWLWALYASARAGSPVNEPMRIMCGMTAAVQLATALATAVLIGGWAAEGSDGFFLGHAAIAALLAVQIGRAKARAAAADRMREEH